MARRPRFSLFLVSLLSLALLPAYGGAAPPKKPAKPAAKPAAKLKKPTGPYFRLDKVTSTFSHFCGFRTAGDKTGEVRPITTGVGVHQHRHLVTRQQALLQTLPPQTPRGTEQGHSHIRKLLSALLHRYCITPAPGQYGFCQRV